MYKYVKKALKMKLFELASVIDIKNINASSLPDMDMICICHDSRKAIPGCIFVCKCGTFSDGHEFAENAYNAGARVFVAQRELNLPPDALVLIVPNTGKALSAMAQKFYSYPQKQLKVIGITGTKGKTTLALSVYEICKKYGLFMGYIGTNGAIYNGVTEQTQNTTPDVLELQRILRNMLDAGVEYVLIEVSSQALWQKRIDGIDFYATLFTNLYRDHIGGVEHPTFEHYLNCKKSLFSEYSSEKIIINYDTEYSFIMVSDADEKKIFTTSASGNENANLCAKNVEMSRKNNSLGVEFDCFGECFCGERIFLPFPGLYSVENALQIIALCLYLGLEKEFIISSLGTLKVSGRFETVTLAHKPDTLFVIDYAHNGASLSSVLKALSNYNPGRIICLFGSVGGRTFGRRGDLALSASEYSDIIIVTSDNPNNESPLNIINQICSHLTNFDGKIYKIEDRAEAVRLAADISQPGDIVLLAGKGHEDYQLIQGRKIPFCEREILLSTQNTSSLFKL